MTQTKITDAQAAVEQVEQQLKQCRAWLSSLDEEQASMEERLKREALLAAENPGEGEAALEQALLRRETLPYLLWAAKVQMMRLQIQHRDARIALLGLKAEKVRDALSHSPGDKALQKQLEDLGLERRMADVQALGIEGRLRALEAAAL